MYKRPQYYELLERLKESRFTIQAIVGPRQIGKSTMVKQVLDDISIPSLFVSADNIDEDNTAWISETWESARAMLKLNGGKEYILAIDEIHKIKNWSEIVKKEWDYDSLNSINIKLIILGSSRILMKDGLTESLAGRYELIRMTHWLYKEVSEAFGATLEQFIFFGGYPGGYRLINNQPRWRKYIKDSIITPSIEKDILLTKRLYKPALMKQLFELGCLYSGQEISFTKLLGQLQDAGNTTTLANYLSVLNESQLLSGLQKFANDNARRYGSIPKMAVYDTALLSALSGSKFEDIFVQPSKWGRWVESAIGMILLNFAVDDDCKVYYWREKDSEVDFVVENNGNVTAIEVKSGLHVNSKGLSDFVKKFNPKNSYIVGSGGIPLSNFFTADASFLS